LEEEAGRGEDRGQMWLTLELSKCDSMIDDDCGAGFVLDEGKAVNGG
jgi:hypothetical protein